MARNMICVRGARQHNLKNITVEIPRDQLVVITGLSGSGKSSLAFDTIYAEGQRRYVESLSAYARQFLGQMDKPDVDDITGLSPAVSIDQKSASRNPRSTVATVTEIYDYLRLLYARIGIPHCPSCGREVAAQTPEHVIDTLSALPDGTRLLLMAPVVRGRKGEYRKEMEEARRQGYNRLRVDGAVLDLSTDELPTLAKYKAHSIEVIIDRLVIRPGLANRLADSVETAMRLGQGTVVAQVVDGDEMVFSDKFACAVCGINLPEIEPRCFSFNSPFGACPECHGLGFTPEFDPDLIIPDDRKSLTAGAIEPFSTAGGGMAGHYDNLLSSVARKLGFSMQTPVNQLTAEQRHALFYGLPDNVTVTVTNRWGKTHYYDSHWEGVCTILQRRLGDTDSDHVKDWLSRYITEKPCAKCQGRRLKDEFLAVTVAGRNIAEVTAMAVSEATMLFDAIDQDVRERDRIIAQQLFKEIRNRLRFLLNVGLGYLTLNRAAGTLAGGEAQRIRLATQIGSGLMGVLYILDEPSIGLHQRDNAKLIQTLLRLRDLGNTVIVVEHDEETMRVADHIVDVGPGAGEHGGEIVAQGALNDIMANPQSVTGAYLSGRRRIAMPLVRRTPSDRWLTIRQARGNNLKNLDVPIPLGLFVCVTGVSGSGKSTLIQETLYPRLVHHIYRAHPRWAPHEAVDGLEHLDKVVDIDQSPIGRTPRSNPATYTGVFDLIRTLFSETEDARVRGYKPGRFSFNVKGGRCEACRGDGILRIEMQFLPDVYVPCETCHGRRYNRETLEVKYKGQSIADVLNMTVSEAMEFFKPVPSIFRKLSTIHAVGLDYIRLGQPATQLSGGEAQRVKLATELARRATGRTIYILDEPTTGLHFADVEKLLQVLQRLVDAGNSVLVIEHNLDVIKCADWIIDMGPEGGDAGGQLVAAGTPEQVASVPGSHTGFFLKSLLDLSE